MSEKIKYYKGHFFFVFYEKDDEEMYEMFNNVKDVVKHMKELGTFPPRISVDENGNIVKKDLNLTPITREEVQFISTKIARSLAREKSRRHLINIFGRPMRVYTTDIKDDDEA